MNTATHTHVASSAGSTSQLVGLNKIVQSARQRVLAWWNQAQTAGVAESGATAEANRVRNLAMSYLRHDPRFAADLFAAADRHEELHGR